MKKQVQITISVITVIILSILYPAGNTAFAQKTKAAMKIGTYDSRIVIFAWSRSDYFKQHMIKFKQQSDSAEKAHDTARVKELSIQAMSFQHLLHLTVFSNGSVGFVMTIVKDKLPELAKTAGVSAILSKWELNFSDPSIEIVDLTSKIAQLFQPKENIDQMSKDISAQQPIPIDEFGIETEMLDGYCKRFGKK
ncbi:MAG: hypothetical protein D4R97_01330 [Bacteroidetes bacterium]|nr:MAG: hypothetical protein D4R97_01330 [Bacteroidota bacterium]